MSRTTASRSEVSVRTHEPALRELVANVDGMYQLFNEKIESLRREIGLSFAASEKAILKAEDAQKDYNVRSNEFRGQLDDQAKRLMPRLEVEKLEETLKNSIARVEEDLRSLRESRSERSGRDMGSRDLRAEARANLALVVAFGGLIVALVVNVLK